jgi:hypothetical protein
MTSEQINELISKGKFPEPVCDPELVETHISWVILCNQYAYKIKKPIQYSFLDFSTIARRKFYCEREVELNRRLTDGIYLGILPIKNSGDQILIGDEEGEIIDYAVCMRKQDRNRQMDLLLSTGQVKDLDIQNLAEKIANFHKNTNIIYAKDFLDVQKKFSDLKEEKDYLRDSLNEESADIISHAMDVSDTFIQANKNHLYARLSNGFFRDCHGDLHSRNIFLLPMPQPFDCIEFNDDLRQIDVLNEVAFLCMDLDAFGRGDLSDLFVSCYNNLFPALRTEEDRKLFIYYKSYRANIRAKVNSLRAKGAKNEVEKKSALRETEKYLRLMDGYINSLEC